MPLHPRVRVLIFNIIAWHSLSLEKNLLFQCRSIGGPFSCVKGSFPLKIRDYLALKLARTILYSDVSSNNINPRCTSKMKFADFGLKVRMLDRLSLFHLESERSSRRKPLHDVHLPSRSVCRFFHSAKNIWAKESSFSQFQANLPM